MQSIEGDMERKRLLAEFLAEAHCRGSDSTSSTEELRSTASRRVAATAQYLDSDRAMARSAFPRSSSPDSLKCMWMVRNRQGGSGS
jgi:hypothetical protein